MSPETQLKQADVELFARCVRETRNTPENFAGGAAFIEAHCSMAAIRRRTRRKLRQYIKELRAEGRDPMSNLPTRAELDDRRELMPSRLPRTRQHLIPDGESVRFIEQFGPTMNRDAAEAVVLVAANHYDTEPDPNPALPPCLQQPAPEELTKHDADILYTVRSVSRISIPPMLIERLRWAWTRIDLRNAVKPAAVVLQKPALIPPSLGTRPRRSMVLLCERAPSSPITGPALVREYCRRWPHDKSLTAETWRGSVVDKIREHFTLENDPKVGYSLPADSPARTMKFDAS